MSPGQRILILLPNWVGDVVMATPALDALYDRLDDRQREVVDLLATPAGHHGGPHGGPYGGPHGGPHGDYCARQAAG